MEKHEKAITGLLSAGLIMEFLRLLPPVLVRSFPEIVLRLMHEENLYEDLRGQTTSALIYLRPGLHFLVMLALFFLLRSECKKPSALSGLFPVLIPLVSVVLSVAGAAISYLVTYYSSRVTSSQAFAANSLLNTATSALTLFIPSGMLFFILAAGAIWYRRKQMQE